MAQHSAVDVFRRANEEVCGEFSMAEDIVDKQKQWISVALRTTESDVPPSSKHNGKLSWLLILHFSRSTQCYLTLSGYQSALGLLDCFQT